MLFDVSDFEFPPIIFFSLTGRSYVYFNTIGVFFQLIGKPFSNHATIAWFFLYHQRRFDILIGDFSRKRDCRIFVVFAVFHPLADKRRKDSSVKIKPHVR